MPRYYYQRDARVLVVRQTIAVNASFLNTHRMDQLCVMHACAPENDRPRRTGDDEHAQAWPLA